jgi:hypothetical protein
MLHIPYHTYAIFDLSILLVMVSPVQMSNSFFSLVLNTELMSHLKGEIWKSCLASSLTASPHCFCMTAKGSSGLWESALIWWCQSTCDTIKFCLQTVSKLLLHRTRILLATQPNFSTILIVMVMALIKEHHEFGSMSYLSWKISMDILPPQRINLKVGGIAKGYSACLEFPRTYVWFSAYTQKSVSPVTLTHCFVIIR